VTKVWVAVVAGAAGVALGLFIAREYAQVAVTSDLNNALNKVGLGGGAIQTLADSFVPQVV
jgi:hypothetical protein